MSKQNTIPLTPNIRLLRTSNPTPPERETTKKQRFEINDFNSSDTDMDSEQHFETIDVQIPQQFAISSEDIQKIANAVRDSMLTEITKIIEQSTAPLVKRIENLEIENAKLRNDLDELDQYGRRTLIRISGIPEPLDESDTTPTVIETLKKIDP